MKYFRLQEFDCHCGRGPACDAAIMQVPFLLKLDDLRGEWGKPLIVKSGRRCSYHNAQIGGAPHSQHLLGNASDFDFEDATDAVYFAALAEKFGFMGIGLGIHLVHIDNREYRARWSYSI